MKIVLPNSKVDELLAELRKDINYTVITGNNTSEITIEISITEDNGTYLDMLTS